MIINDHINYWLETAENDLSAVDAMFDSGKYDCSLFIGHLVIEKALKALFVKINNNIHPPKTHNLLKLAKECDIEIDEDKIEFYDLVNSFHLESRYPAYKNEFYKIVTKEFAEKNIIKIKENYKWLKSQIM